MVKLKRIFRENGKAMLLAIAAIALTAAIMPTIAFRGAVFSSFSQKSGAIESMRKIA